MSADLLRQTAGKSSLRGECILGVRGTGSNANLSSRPVTLGKYVFPAMICRYLLIRVRQVRCDAASLGVCLPLPPSFFLQLNTDLFAGSLHELRCVLHRMQDTDAEEEEDEQQERHRQVRLVTSAGCRIGY